jgi:CheY-like chemotaxis protein
MEKPLALVCYRNIVPGSQICNRLLDLGYRVETADTTDLEHTAEREKPLVILAEVSRQLNTCSTIAKLKRNPKTQHIPVLAYSNEVESELAAARQAGASLLANGGAILGQLPQLIEQVLVVE